MEKKQALALCLCFITCYSFFIFNVGASSSPQVIVSSYGSISLSPTPTPTPSSPNLEPLSAFYADMNGAASSYASLDYSTLHNGDVSIRVAPDYVRGSREVDGAWLSVSPGDHIVFSAWVKTASFSSSDPYPGGRLGIDFYISSSLGYGIACISPTEGAGHPSNAEGASGYDSAGGGLVRLLWGNDWTLLIWDFYIPTEAMTYVNGAGGVMTIRSCAPTYINSMIPWLDVRNVNDSANAWFADPTLYINP